MINEKVVNRSFLVQLNFVYHYLKIKPTHKIQLYGVSVYLGVFHHDPFVVIESVCPRTEIACIRVLLHYFQLLVPLSVAKAIVQVSLFDHPVGNVLQIFDQLNLVLGLGRVYQLTFGINGLEIWIQ